MEVGRSIRYRDGVGDPPRPIVLEASPSATPRLVSRWRLLVVLTVIQAGMSAVQYGIAALLPAIKNSLDLSVAGTTVLVSSINAGALIGALPAGALTDRIGERRALTGGATLAGLGVFAAALLGRPWLMPVPLFFAGIAVVVSHPSGVRVIMRRFAQRERGRAHAVRQTAVPLGIGIAALTLPPLAAVLGWRVALGTLGLVGPLVGLLAWTMLPPEPATPPAGGRRLGSTLALLRTVPVLLAVLVCLCLNAGQVATTTFLALYVNEGLGRSLRLSTALLALLQVSGIGGRVLWGVVSDRLTGGRRRPPLIGVGLGAAASVALLAALRPGAPLPLLIAVTIAAGLTAMSWNGVAIALTSETAGAAGAARAMSAIVLVAAAGNAVIPLLGGSLIDATGSYRTIWLGTAAVLLLAPVLTVAVREPKGPTA